MKRKGFTLVELLIVIVVIGILSAMMMMSSSEAVSSSRATQIAANMRNLQTAALAYWADNMSKFNKSNPDTPQKADVFRYLKDADAANIDDTYYDVAVNNKNWYIKFTFSGSMTSDKRLKAKLADRAGSLGLLGGNGNAPKTTKYKDENTMFILVR